MITATPSVSGENLSGDLERRTASFCVDVAVFPSDVVLLSGHYELSLLDKSSRTCEVQHLSFCSPLFPSLGLQLIFESIALDAAIDR